MTQAVKFTDVSIFQPSSYSYMKGLKDDGSQFNFVKLTEGSSYINPSAHQQLKSSLAVFGQIGIYHYWHGESAGFFIKKAKCQSESFKILFSDIKVALDVEADDLPWYCTNRINAFETQLVNAGFKPSNIFTYASNSWIQEGRVNPNGFKYGYMWCAYYPYSNVYEDNAIKPNSPILPRYNAVQFSGLGSQDWSFAFNGCLNDPKPNKIVRPKRVMSKKVTPPANHYLQNGKEFEVITGVIHGYSDQPMKHRNGWDLVKGSHLTGQVIKFNGYTRLNTAHGWFSTNTKYLKVVKN